MTLRNLIDGLQAAAMIHGDEVEAFAEDVNTGERFPIGEITTETLDGESPAPIESPAEKVIVVIL